MVFQALAEALILAERAGLDLEQVIQVVRGGLAYTRCLELRKSNILSRCFDPGFRVALHRKNLGIALEAGKNSASLCPDLDDLYLGQIKPLRYNRNRHLSSPLVEGTLLYQRLLRCLFYVNVRELNQLIH